MTEATATYCPEDDKLRLYVGRVPRDEYEALRAQGWMSTPKQACDFVATWTPDREEMALSYADEIEDEEQSPADRAADRAERFAGYLDKRRAEAGALADRYDDGPTVHGYQSRALAERRAAQHDAVATRAVSRWSKAEYWRTRTAGVIANALHRAAPGVRYGRIKGIESEIRKLEKSLAEAREWRRRWGLVREWSATDPDRAERGARELADHDRRDYQHPDNAEVRASLYRLLHPLDGSGVRAITAGEAAALWFGARPSEPGAEGTRSARWLNHLRLRLEYETAMLDAEGGRAAHIEMEPGGWIGSHQIQRVHKSPATGRVVSVEILAPKGGNYDRKGKPYGEDNPRPIVSHKLTVERLSAEVYRAPTDEERAQFAADKKAAAKERAKTAPKAPPLVNLTEEDAHRLLAVWVAADPREYSTPRKVHVLTQAEYSAASKGGNYAAAETVEITGGGRQSQRFGVSHRVDCPTVAKVRTYRRGPVVLSDKPQKPLSAEMWHDPRPEIRAAVLARLPELRAALACRWSSDWTDEQRALVDQARVVKLAYCDSLSQFGLTAAGEQAAREIEAAAGDGAEAVAA